jgi:hypothetical protein
MTYFFRFFMQRGTCKFNTSMVGAKVSGYTAIQAKNVTAMQTAMQNLRPCCSCHYCYQLFSILLVSLTFERLHSIIFYIIFYLFLLDHCLFKKIAPVCITTWRASDVRASRCKSRCCRCRLGCAKWDQLLGDS